jgi:hypothetical protein
VADSTLADGGANAGSKLYSGEERLLQSDDGSAAAPRRSGAIMIAIQQAPEWLRPLLLILSASRRQRIDEAVSGHGKIKKKW